MAFTLGPIDLASKSGAEHLDARMPGSPEVWDRRIKKTVRQLIYTECFSQARLIRGREVVLTCDLR